MKMENPLLDPLNGLIRTLQHSLEDLSSEPVRMWTVIAIIIVGLFTVTVVKTMMYRLGVSNIHYQQVLKRREEQPSTPVGENKHFFGGRSRAGT